MFSRLASGWNAGLPSPRPISILSRYWRGLWRGLPREVRLAILHDVTELERLERVRKDFVANVSHELRTPLAAIRGYAETLLDGALEDQENNHRFVEIIQAQATRLTNIASDLLTISELGIQQRRPAPKPVSIRSALESALRTVESGARVRGVHFAVREAGRLAGAWETSSSWNRSSSICWTTRSNSIGPTARCGWS